MEVVFWISFGLIAYAYFGYPLVLMIFGLAVRQRTRMASEPLSPADAPSISILIPAHNEEGVIGAKLDNAFSLYYPGEMQIIVVSDGSTDSTSQIVSSYSDDSRLLFVDLPERKGKANALNSGIGAATGDVVVFSDASILLEEQALWEVVQPFANSDVGCVSGEDRIKGGGGEGLYGEYELFLRRQESNLGSIVGASGSFYAQRKSLVTEFPEGVAPDFLSVLNTVQRGYRAVSASKAIGYMTAIADSKNEFRRKVRTVIRGMTALFQNRALLNPIRYPVFSFFLLSHKVVRWCVPIFLLLLLLINLFLLESTLYQLLLVAQLSFYSVALLAHLSADLLARSSLMRIALYFSVSNAAILVAWVKYLRGFRQEIWGPSKRAT